MDTIPCTTIKSSMKDIIVSSRPISTQDTSRDIVEQVPESPSNFQMQNRGDDIKDIPGQIPMEIDIQNKEVRTTMIQEKPTDIIRNLDNVQDKAHMDHSSTAPDAIQCNNNSIQCNRLAQNQTSQDTLPAHSEDSPLSSRARKRAKKKKKMQDRTLKRMRLGTTVNNKFQLQAQRKLLKFLTRLLALKGKIRKFKKKLTKLFNKGIYHQEVSKIRMQPKSKIFQ
ncbi:hypothetical protein A4A49_61553, partial [Nicotiana attenuata]